MNWNVIFLAKQRCQIYSSVMSRDFASNDFVKSERSSFSSTIDFWKNEISFFISTHIKLNIDSADGFVFFLIVTREDFHWKASRFFISNFQSFFHINSVSVQWWDENTQRLRHSRRSVHHISHLLFGRLKNFVKMKAYFLFLCLFHSQRKHEVITQEKYTLWIDRIFLLVVRNCSDLVAFHHLLFSATHIQLNFIVGRVKQRSQMKHEQSRAQKLFYFLKHDTLDLIWKEINRLIEHQDLQQFQNQRLLLIIKNLKLMTQRSIWSDMYDDFIKIWTQIVDREHFIENFYDVAKKVVSRTRSSSRSERIHVLATLIWRRCCLNSFCDWLAKLKVTLNAFSSAFETRVKEVEETSAMFDVTRDHLSRRSVRLRERTRKLSIDRVSLKSLKSSIEKRTKQSSDANVDEEDANETWFDSIDSDANIDEENANETSFDSVDSDANVDEKDVNETSFNSVDSDFDSEINFNRNLTQNSKASWRKEFYSFFFLRDMSSMTLKSHRRSRIRRAGLLYCQFYITLKKILVAGNHYLFQNRSLDILALDSGLIRTWRHVRKGFSHSLSALLQVYIHIKQRCHVALDDCRNRLYDTREKYRVSGFVLTAMNQVFRQEDLPETLIFVSLSLAFFFSHRTDQLLNWLRWNINKLCLRFELIYSLQSRDLVHWKHTRVMMMFLRCLLCVYDEQNNHIRRSNELWLNRQSSR